MKNIFFAITLLLITATAFSQSRERKGALKFGLGPAIGYATSNPLKDAQGNKGWGLGAGAMVQLEHFFRGSLSGIAQAGVISFTGRSSGVSSKNKGYTTIPIRVGANGYVGNLHLGALIGVGLNSFAGGNKTAFNYSPQIGYNFSRNDLPLDFTVSYEGYVGHGEFSAFLLRLSLIL